MNTNFVYTFKTRNAALNHLRALAQLSCSISNSKLPLSDFAIDYPSIMEMMSYLKRGYRKSLYFGFRHHGFEFKDSSMLFDGRMSCFSDVIASYVMTYADGYYRLVKWPLESPVKSLE